MHRIVDHGTGCHPVTQDSSKSFVNRRSTVQSCPPAPRSNYSDFTQVTALDAVEAYLDGTGTARRATAALAYLAAENSGRPVAA